MQWREQVNQTVSGKLKSKCPLVSVKTSRGAPINHCELVNLPIQSLIMSSGDWFGLGGPGWDKGCSQEICSEAFLISKLANS
jgi:hypothetical protein